MTLMDHKKCIFNPGSEISKHTYRALRAIKHLQMPQMPARQQQTVSVGSKRVQDGLVSHARPPELIFNSGSEILAM